MNISETKALGWAVLAAAVSLGGTLLMAKPIAFLATTDMSPAETAPATTFPLMQSSPALVEQGHQFFEMSCSQCHGDDAHGDEGPDLHNLALSNARITNKIKKGIKGEMPSFSKKYNDAQVAILLGYLRTLK